MTTAMTTATTTKDRWVALSRSMDEAIAALTVFDAEALEALEQRIHAVTAEYVAHGIPESREALPELLRKHALLQAVLQATAVNLKVMGLDTRRTRAHDRRDEFHGYLDLTAEPGEKRADR